MALKKALENSDRAYYALLQMNYSEIPSDSLRDYLAEKKYLERPFTYEFHHQMRKLIDEGDVDFGGPILQAEIEVEPQPHLKNEKIPDYILHIPTINRKLGIIEFRLASNPRKIEFDLEKLAVFRREFAYPYVIEAIIGNTVPLRAVKEYLTLISNPDGEKIMIVEFDVDAWKVVAGMIGYKNE